MKERVCCILDRDENYATRLTNYINDRHMMPYQVMAFTSKESVVRCCEKYSVEILLVSEEMYDEEFKNQDILKIVKLSGDKFPDKEDCTVYRYQPADQVVKSTLYFMDGYKLRYNMQEKDCSLIAVYSPATKCFKTTLAMGLALWAAKSGKALYINLEQFAGLGKILPDNAKGLSEALYMYKSGGKNALNKIIACTNQTHGFDYLYPVTCAEDISELNCEELIGFIKLISDSGIYQNIIIDVGNIFNKPWKIMEICSCIAIPKPIDQMGQNKLADMEKYLLAMGRIEGMDNIVKVNIPIVEAMAGSEISYGYLESAEMKKITGGILNN